MGMWCRGWRLPRKNSRSRKLKQQTISSVQAGEAALQLMPLLIVSKNETSDFHESMLYLTCSQLGKLQLLYLVLTVQGVFICKALAFWSLWSTSETLLKVVYFSQLPRKKGFDLKTQAVQVSKGIVVQAGPSYIGPSCVFRLQPSKASIIFWPMVLHSIAHKPGATGGNAHFLGKVPQARSFQVHRVAADTPPTPPRSAFSWTRILVLAAVSHPSLLQQQPSTWPVQWTCQYSDFFLPLCSQP